MELNDTETPGLEIMMVKVTCPTGVSGGMSIEVCDVTIPVKPAHEQLAIDNGYTITCKKMGSSCVTST